MNTREGFQDVPLSSGFTFADHHDLCKISGLRVLSESKLSGHNEKTTDTTGYTCSKLDRATYVVIALRAN